MCSLLAACTARIEHNLVLAARERVGVSYVIICKIIIAQVEIVVNPVVAIAELLIEIV
jgi:hypothetical protein